MNDEKEFEKKSEGIVNNHTRIDELPTLGLRITRHDESVELSSKGYNMKEAMQGIDYLLKSRDCIIDKPKDRR